MSIAWVCLVFLGLAWIVGHDLRSNRSTKGDSWGAWSLLAIALAWSIIIAMSPEARNPLEILHDYLSRVPVFRDLVDH